MSDLSSKWTQATFADLLSATGSAELEAGPKPSASQTGRKICRSGPDRHPVSPSALPGSGSGAMTLDTSPPILHSWSGPVAPSCCLANRSPAQTFSARFQRQLTERLQQRLHGHGAMIYKTVWKVRVTPMGRQICALRASALRTLDSVSFSALFAGMPSGSSVSGWPTTTVTDGLKQGAVSPRPGMMGLSETAPLAGWPTPTTRDWKDTAGMATTGINPDGSERSRLDRVGLVAQLAGWPTCAASDGSGGGQAKRAANPERSNDLMDFALLADNPEPVRFTISGQMLTGCSAGMNGGGQLNPLMSAWLMGYPLHWTLASLE